MSVRINFNLVHPCFHEPLCVPVDWDFPFLPRVGESVGGWVWIRQGHWEQSEVEKELSEEGKKSWEEHRSDTFGFDDWLYEVSMECDIVCSVTYHRRHDTPDTRVDMYLNADGKPL
jgi:hypothetical protein